MNQTGAIFSLDVGFALIALILTYAWIRGTVSDNAENIAALLRECQEDYNSPSAIAARAAMDRRDTILRQEDANRADQILRWRSENAGLDILHRDGTVG